MSEVVGRARSDELSKSFQPHSALLFVIFVCASQHFFLAAKAPVLHFHWPRPSSIVRLVHNICEVGPEHMQLRLLFLGAPRQSLHLFIVPKHLELLFQLLLHRLSRALLLAALLE